MAEPNGEPIKSDGEPKQPLGSQISLDEIKTLVANLDEAGKEAVAAEAIKTASEPQAVLGEILVDQVAESTHLGPRGTTSPTRRLNVVFSESAYNTLKDLADQSGKTISDTVRDAIALQKWFNDVRREGGRILVEQRGRVREILNIR